MWISARLKKPASIILLALLVSTISCSSIGRRTAIHALPDWQPVSVLGPGHLKHIAYAPKGHKVAICTTRSIEIWDAITWQMDRELLGGMRTAAWSPDGSQLVSGAHAHTVKIWDVLTGRVLRTLTGHQCWITGVWWSPEGRTIVSQDHDNTIFIWDAPASRKTEVSIRGEAFFINGRPTYAGRTWQGQRIEGLLLNARMVQGIFDDLNPQTRARWAYPDTGRWDPERNTREFIAAMPEWRRHGLLAFTSNLQGGSPQGYSREQPWHNSAFTEIGDLRPEYMARLERILDRADELGMVVILGLFYFGQDERLKDEAAVRRGLDNAIEWIFKRGYRNILIEVNNECNVRYHHAILQPERVHELIERVKARMRDGRRLLVSTSYGGGTIPHENVVRHADFLLLHGNGVSKPERIAEMVRQTRRVPGYRPMPILFNEDDHFDFDKPRNNLRAAIGEYCSWGYFDPGQSNYVDGYQCPPVNWQINTERKRSFFGLIKKITGH